MNEYAMVQAPPTYEPVDKARADIIEKELAQLVIQWHVGDRAEAVRDLAKMRTSPDAGEREIARRFDEGRRRARQAEVDRAAAEQVAKDLKDARAVAAQFEEQNYADRLARITAAGESDPLVALMEWSIIRGMLPKSTPENNRILDLFERLINERRP